MFQFALPRGERPTALIPCPTNAKFQFALPRGERPTALIPCPTSARFQFALPRGERLSATAAVKRSGKFQFALPRGERLDNLIFRHDLYNVSIRAPAWGATDDPISNIIFSLSFNSRSRVGSDLPTWRGSPPQVRFNSRSRVGSDAASAWAAASMVVSIRAPA